MNNALRRKLQRTGKDQYILTIPKTLIQVLSWKESQLLSFGFEKGKLTLSPSSQKTSSFPTRTLQKTPKGQYTLTIPKLLVQLLQWHAQDHIYFSFEQGNISLRKGDTHA